MIIPEKKNRTQGSQGRNNGNQARLSIRAHAKLARTTHQFILTDQVRGPNFLFLAVGSCSSSIVKLLNVALLTGTSVQHAPLLYASEELILMRLHRDEQIQKIIAQRSAVAHLVLTSW